MEDNFSTDGGGRGAGGSGEGGERDGSGGNASNGELQMKLPLPFSPLTSCCAAPFLTGLRRVPVRGPGIGDPWFKASG